MPRVDVVKRTPVKETFRVAKVQGMFDLPRETASTFELHVDVPLDEKPWSIGLITGASGTGKSTAARQLWPNVTVQGSRTWPDGALVDGFDDHLGAQDVASVLSSVGLSSVPAWLRPYAVLSTGQQFRADLAHALTKCKTDQPPVVFDEFTSTVDRTVAKTVSVSAAKHVRRTGGQFVAVTCHGDVEPWLQPDWVLNTEISEFTWRSVQSRPAITVDIREAGREARSTWPLFREHHYLSGNLAPSCRAFLVYVTIDGETRLAAFTSIMPAVGYAGRWREHRTVVLPDFQGIGIGNRISELVGETLWRDEGKRFYSVTSAPGYVHHRVKHPDRWVLRRAPGQSSPAGANGKVQTSAGRLTTGWLYIPEELRGRERTTPPLTRKFKKPRAPKNTAAARKKGR